MIIFTRAMRNLLDNAGKYSADGTFKLQSYQDVTSENPFLVIRISNPIKDVEHLSLDSVFDRFYKGDQARSDGNSSGLGLAITERIIELHGGSIRAEINEMSEFNEISEFSEISKNSESGEEKNDFKEFTVVVTLPC